jgi:hypothetical protein
MDRARIARDLVEKFIIDLTRIFMRVSELALQRETTYYCHAKLAISETRGLSG